MGLKSSAPIQIRLMNLEEKGYISRQEGKATTLKLVNEIVEGILIICSITAGSLIDTFSDLQETLEISDVLKKIGIFLIVNGDSIIDERINDGDMVLIEPIKDIYIM